MGSFIDYVQDHIYLIMAVFSGFCVAIGKMFKLVRSIVLLEERITALENKLVEEKKDLDGIVITLTSQLARIESKLDSYIISRFK